MVTALEIKVKHALRIRKPALWARVLFSYMKFFIGKAHLRYVVVGYDYDCNLRCEHCFAENFTRISREKMSIEDHRKFAKQAMDSGAWNFGFQGGEPFYQPSFKFLKEIIPVYKPFKNTISVVTNGWYVTEERCREIKDLGVDTLTVSIDSGIEEEHDRIRNMEGSWRRAMDAVEYALGCGMNVVVNTVITHQSIHSEGLTKIIEFAEERNLILNSLLAVPEGRWEGAKNVMLTEEDWEYYHNVLQKEHQLVKRDIGFSFWRRGCGAVKEMIYLTAYGDVCPCPFMHISLGNITEEPLKQILQRGLSTKIFGRYHPKCLMMESHNFVDKYLKIIAEVDYLPIPISKCKELLN